MLDISRDQDRPRTLRRDHRVADPRDRSPSPRQLPSRQVGSAALLACALESRRHLQQLRRSLRQIHRRQRGPRRRRSCPPHRSCARTPCAPTHQPPPAHPTARHRGQTRPPHPPPSCAPPGRRSIARAIASTGAPARPVRARHRQRPGASPPLPAKPKRRVHSIAVFSRAIRYDIAIISGQGMARSALGTQAGACRSSSPRKAARHALASSPSRARLPRENRRLTDPLSHPRILKPSRRGASYP